MSMIITAIVELIGLELVKVPKTAYNPLREEAFRVKHQEKVEETSRFKHVAQMAGEQLLNWVQKRRG